MAQKNTHAVTETGLVIYLQTQTPETARELLRQGLRAALHYYVSSNEKIPNHTDGILQLMEVQEALE